MFISNYEKEQMRVSIRTLQAQVKQLFEEIATLKAADKSKKISQRVILFKTDEAPWGYKKDGTPRKRPGRPAPTVAKGVKV